MEYKESAKFKAIAIDMLSTLETINKIPTNDKFNVCIDTLAQAVINPLKISYIKKDKIKNLLEHAGIKITDKPTTEQREKYFNCCSLQKFANNFFNKEGLTQEQLQEFNDIVEKATKDANTTLKKEFHILDKEFIPTIYNMQNNKSECKIALDVDHTYKEFSISIDGSCMQGKPENYFDIYKDINTDTNDIKIAILTQGTEIIARALVWLDAPASEIDRRKKQKPATFFIDRIYTKTQQHRTETQTALYLNILKYYNCLEVMSEPTPSTETEAGMPKHIKIPNFYNLHNISEAIQRELEKQHSQTLKISCSNYASFDVKVNKDYYNSYPYMDSFQWFNTYSNSLSADEENDIDILKLDSTSGGYSNTSRCECEHCGYEVHSEDDLVYIETEDLSACEDCATYCDERDEYILTDDAIYNNHTGQYHYRCDLDY
jgi:hypothetical protein